TLGTTPSATSATLTVPPPTNAPTTGQKTEEKSDTMKYLDDPVYGIKTEVLSPNRTLTEGSIANDPFETYAVPAEMRHILDAPQRSIYKRAESDISTSPGAKSNPNTYPTRLEDVPVYTPPEESPQPASVKKRVSTRNPVPSPSQNP
ncbi:hypothetical protein PFISCL1PPCAC_4308, partial [Pristionchus fissidentatus]